MIDIIKIILVVMMGMVVVTSVYELASIIGRLMDKWKDRKCHK